MMAQPALADASLLPATTGAALGPLTIVHAMLRVLAHHWWKILAIWAVLTAGLVYAISVRIKPVYSSFSQLRVEPADRDLFGLGLGSAEVFDRFLQTQVQLITSPNVLIAALANKEVAATEIVRKSADPESTLRANLQVGVVPGTYMISVSMNLQQPGDAAVIINKVVESYVEVANAWSNEKNMHQIKRMQEYNSELTIKVKEREEQWLALAASGNVDLIVEPPAMAAAGANLPQGTQSRVTVEEYKNVREQLFRTNMDLIEAEALLNNRQAEIAAQGAGMDPEELLHRRVAQELRRDADIHGLLSQIDRANHKIVEVSRLSRSGSDPSLTNAQLGVRALEAQLRKLIDRKRDLLTQSLRENDPGNPHQVLRELASEIAALKARKRNYEGLLGKLEVTNRLQGTDAVKMSLVQTDLASLRAMQDSVMKRIEQLSFDSRGEARIKKMHDARASWEPISDRRKKLWYMAPVGVLAAVLGLFLFFELLSGRVADVEEFSRRVPVEVYPVPSLPGTRRTSDQRMLRANEAQLQEFLQSLDHLRVSLWFGKEAVAGSGRCLTITSAIGGEGKTTLAAHLAVCCAKAGVSTLVIDADLRRASLSRMFEEEQTPGLSDVLKGDLQPEDAPVALRDGGFHLLPAGSPGQHPGWLFREERIGQVLARYRQMFDLVIIDTPPVLPVADTLSLGRWVDGAVLVIRYDVSRFPLVDRARRRLIAAGIPILKTVVNGVKNSRFAPAGYNYSYGYGYGGGYGYGERTMVAAESRAPSSNGYSEPTTAVDS